MPQADRGSVWIVDLTAFAASGKDVETNLSWE